MLAQPVFLFADEPTSRLDPITQYDVALLITDFAADGTTCLLASHDLDLLASATGTIVRIGPNAAL